MPQMAPLFWLPLFFSFLMIFLLFNILNYFNFKLENKNETLKNLTINDQKQMLNWKW